MGHEHRWLENAKEALFKYVLQALGKQAEQSKLRKLDKEGKAFCKSVRLLQLAWLSSVLIGQWRSTHLPTFSLVKVPKRICPCKVYFSILLNVFVKCMLSFNWAREEGTPLSHLEEHTSEPEWACCLPGAGIWRENVKTQQPSLTTDTLNCFTLALPSEGRRVAEPAWHIIEKGLTTVNQKWP